MATNNQRNRRRTQRATQAPAVSVPPQNPRTASQPQAEAPVQYEEQPVQQAAPPPQYEQQPAQQAAPPVQYEQPQYDPASIPPVPQPPPEPQPEAPKLTVPQMLDKLNRAYSNLRRHQAAYTDLQKQHQSLGAAKDLKAEPLMPMWKTSDPNGQMVEVGVDFGWIPEEQLAPILSTLINATGAQFRETIEDINELSGELLDCLDSINPQS